jgi:recombination protein RecA
VTTREEAEAKLRATQFVKSGSTLLDLVLGGGWALSRVSNVVGDKSTGKTLIAIEGFANFTRQYPTGLKGYGEAESSFDEAYASVLGFPDDVYRPPQQLKTVEDMNDDVTRFIERCNKAKVPGFYALDSLDALSDAAEIKKAAEQYQARQKGEVSAGDFGAAKAKAMSRFFRLLNQDVAKSNIHFMVISQTRDNIDASYGEHKTRSGGEALNFYASQVIWLYEAGKIEKQRLNQTRALGVSVRAKSKKSKVGLPYRETAFDIIFGYGIDDEMSMLEFLKGCNRLDKLTAKEALVAGKEPFDEYKDIKDAVETARSKQDWGAVTQLHTKLVERTTTTWWEIEDFLKPPMAKYPPLEVKK